MKQPNKQKQFVNEYLIDLNATQAAIRAGYSKKTARSQGQRLLTNVDIQKAIRESIDKIMIEKGITIESVVEELSLMALLDPCDYFHWGPDGVKVKDMDSLPPEKRRAIVDLYEVKTKDGQTIRIKFGDKLKALEMLARYLQMFNDKKTHTHDVSDTLDNLLKEMAESDRAMKSGHSVN